MMYNSNNSSPWFFLAGLIAIFGSIRFYLQKGFRSQEQSIGIITLHHLSQSSQEVAAFDHTGLKNLKSIFLNEKMEPGIDAFIIMLYGAYAFDSWHIAKNMHHIQNLLWSKNGRFKALVEKLPQTEEGLPLSPLTSWDLATIEHCHEGVLFWENIERELQNIRFQSEQSPHKESSQFLVSFIQNNLPDMRELKTKLDNFPHIKLKITQYGTEYFHGAQLTIIDSNPFHAILLQEPSILSNEKLVNAIPLTRYVSTALILPQSNTAVHLTASGYEKVPFSGLTAALMIPMRVELISLLPRNLSSEEIKQAYDCFNNRLITEGENPTSPMPTHRGHNLSTLWHRGLFLTAWQKHSIESSANTNFPTHCCSSFLAIQLMRAFDEVNKLLKSWGHTGLVKHPFGQHTRMDAIVPSDLVAIGITEGWLTRVRNPEAEKWIESPPIIAGMNECIAGNEIADTAQDNSRRRRFCQIL